MKPPGGYFPLGNKVCRLKKSLYGLKQAPRQWNAKLNSALIENGFSQSKSDYSLYTKSDKDVFLALLFYVDDNIITGKNVSDIDMFKVFLKSKFTIKDLGKLKYFLGVELACKPAKTPSISKLVISYEATDNGRILDNITDYQNLMGKLIYLTNTRPDISYVVWASILLRILGKDDKKILDHLKQDLMDVVFDGAFGGVGDEEVVVGEDVNEVKENVIDEGIEKSS
ncbi:ribonuclease H-like domain-containing protein [Tanacetum coccineum]|uniref:Ribonuclease H-like domain-containing protein n=1 Tax=Tanacetum coccineum TaxID=301880 RepID=A0ABQ5AGZ1_9ASTR